MGNETNVIKMRKTSEGVFQSGVKGITWEKNIDTWRASIRVEGEERIIGFNPILGELIPLMQMAEKKKEEGVEAFNEWYKEVIGREKRIVTPCEFQSDVAGVSYLKRQNKWLAQISIENRKYVLGITEIQEDAESMRKEAEKIKKTCEETINDTGIIDYTPLYKHLEALQIEKQESKLNARIGTGHGKKAWRRLKKEEHALDELVVKSLKGEVVTELKNYKKAKKQELTKTVCGYSNIEYAYGQYYIFLDIDEKKTFIGKTSNIFQAILLFEKAIIKAHTDSWIEFFEVDLQMGMKIPSLEELLDEFNLSMERYDKLLKINTELSQRYYSILNNKNRENLGNNIVFYHEDNRKSVYKRLNTPDYIASVVVNINGYNAPLDGFCITLNENEPKELINPMIENLYNIEDAKLHIENDDFWHWYIFESEMFAKFE